MSWDHILDQRLADWTSACEAWGFDFDPQITADALETWEMGRVELRAHRPAEVDGKVVQVTLTVEETWSLLPHLADSRLDRHQGSVVGLKWHVQVGSDIRDGDHAERFEVALPDKTHPRIHRHPYGAINDVRKEDEFHHPDGFSAG